MAYTLYETLGGPNDILGKIRDFLVANGFTILNNCTPDIDICDDAVATLDGQVLAVKKGDLYAIMRSANGKIIFDGQINSTQSYGIGLTCSTNYTVSPPSGKWFDQPNVVVNTAQQVIGVGMPAKAGSNYRLYCNYVDDPAIMVKMLVVSDGVLYRCANYHTSFDFTLEKDQWEIVAGKGARIADWQPSVDYLQFETVFVDSSLYRAKAAHTAGLDFAADAAGWELLSNRKIIIGDWKTGEKYETGECAIKSGHMYRAKVAHTAAIFANDIVNWELIDLSYLAEWAVLTPYKAQETVLYQGFVYRTKAAHTSGIDFEANYWDLLAKGYLEAWQSGVSYIKGEAVIYAGHLLRCIAEHIAAVNFADDLAKWEVLSGAVTEWRADAFYFIGDLVTKEGLLYCCTVAHVGSSMNSTKFKQITIGYMPKWQTDMPYILHQTVTYEDKVLRCIMPHKARIVFDAKEAEYWETVARTKILVMDWQIDNDYEEKEVVVQDGKIYRCVKSHNSGDKFKQIYWEILSGADANETKQITKIGVVAPLSVEVPINYTTKFGLPRLRF